MTNRHALALAARYMHMLSVQHKRDGQVMRANDYAAAAAMLYRHTNSTK